MTLEAQINLLTVPQEFVRLCNALLRAQHEEDFLPIDDDVPDGGNDGYLRSECRMFAMHCFKRPQNQGIETLVRRKMVGDLGKAIALKRADEWKVDAWTFVSNYPVSSRVGADLIRMGSDAEIKVSWMGPAELAVLLEAHPSVQERFPTLMVNRISDRLGALHESVVELAQDPGSERFDPAAVPRTPAHQSRLIAEKPDCWEYLLFAGTLQLGLDRREFAYLDHTIGIARNRQAVDFDTARSTIGAVFGRLGRVFDSLEDAFQPGPQEHAFGRPGEAGSPLAIQHLAEVVLISYDSFLNASEELRSIEPPALLRQSQALSLQQIDVQISTVRTFIERVISEIERLPERIKVERSVVLDLVLEVELDPEISAALDADIKRVNRKLRWRSWTGLDIEQH